MGIPVGAILASTVMLDVATRHTFLLLFETAIAKDTILPATALMSFPRAAQGIERDLQRQPRERFQRRNVSTSSFAETSMRRDEGHVACRHEAACFSHGPSLPGMVKRI